MPAPQFYDEDTGCLTFANAIANPTGGATTDAEARAAIVSILTALRAAGIIQQD